MTNPFGNGSLDDLIEKFGDTPIVFGLRAQGHLPTIERMLEEGRTWEEIGQEIGWCSKTAERHYGWIKNEQRLSKGK